MMNEWLKKLIPRDSEKYEYVTECFKIILANKGIDFSELEYLTSGESSIVFSYRNEVIKLTGVYNKEAPLIDYIKDSASILPIDFQEKINLNDRFDLYVLANKKLDTSNIDKYDVADMYCQLRRDGYLWDDTKPSNIGKDEDGYTFLIDYGELINLNLLDENQKEYKLNHHKIYKKEYDDIYENGGLIRKETIKDKLMKLIKKR